MLLFFFALVKSIYVRLMNSALISRFCSPSSNPMTQYLLVMKSSFQLASVRNSGMKKQFCDLLKPMDTVLLITLKGFLTDLTTY